MMKKHHSSRLGLLGALGVVGLLACGSAEDPSLQLRSEAATADPNSGENGVATSIDPALLEQLGLRGPYPEAGNRLKDPSLPSERQIYALHVTWGNHRSVPEVPQTTWDGEISVSDGARIHAMRSVMFERRDRLPAQKVSTAVPFISRTGPHVDGLILRAAVHNDVANPTLSVTSAALAEPVVLALDQIEPLPNGTLIDVDQSNQLWIHAVKVTDGVPCEPKGLFGGVWQPRDANGIGSFVGRWTNIWGELGGYVWGSHHHKANESVFEGYYSNVYGLYQGTISGTVDSEQKLFHGKWTSMTGATAGQIDGRYFASEDADVLDGGWFNASWTNEACD
jgi:hypothetical protein